MPTTDRRRVKREVDETRAQNSDISRMSLPVLIVCGLLVTAVTSALSASGAIWAMQRSNDAGLSKLQADVAVIRTLMDGARELTAANVRAQEANTAALGKSLETTVTKLEALEKSIANDRTMNAIQVASLQKAIAELSGQIRR